MSLDCDSCDAEITEQTRPEAFVPLANGGGIDLCGDCAGQLAAYFGGAGDDLPSTDGYPNEQGAGGPTSA